MSRFLLLLGLLALLVPAASAQVPSAGPDVTLTLTGHPTQVDAVDNVTVALTLQVSVSNLVCLPGPGVLSIAIGATFAPAGNSTGNLTVDPIAPVAVTLPAASTPGSAVTDSEAIAINLRANGPASGEVVVTASVQSINNCVGQESSATSQPVSFRANFSPTSATTDDPNGDAEVTPGFELPLLLGALAVLAVALRRRNA